MSRYALRLSLLLLVAATAGACSATVHQPIRFGPAPVVFATRPLASFDRGLPAAATPTLPIPARDTAVNDFAGVPSVPLIPSVSVETLFRDADAQYVVPRAQACPGGIMAASTTVADVQAAVNLTGQKVCIPAGTVTWATPLTITTKSMTLVGPDCTLSQSAVSPACGLIIVGNVGSVPIITVTNCSASNFVTIGHMTLRVLSTGSSDGMIMMNCTADLGAPAQIFRTHHVQFDSDPTDGTSTNSGRWFVADGANGVVDHCQFLAQTARGAGNVSAGSSNGPSTVNTYHHPFSFGDANAVYFEDSFFYSKVANQGNGATDNYLGARYVFRYNTVYNNNIGHHGWDSQTRGVPTFEAYGNTFIAENGVDGIALYQPRSGTGIVWGNTVTNQGSGGYNTFMTPIYYAGQSVGDLYLNQAGAFWYSGRPDTASYPVLPWCAGGVCYAGTTTKSETPNYVGYARTHQSDGNQYAADSLDSDYSRVVTDMSTTSGSPNIHSENADFVAGDRAKFIVPENFKRGYILTDCAANNGNTTLTCASGTFSAGDVGRFLSFDDRTDFAVTGEYARIATVTDGTHVVLDHAPTSTGTKTALFTDPFLLTITDENDAVMSTNATATGSSKSLSIGYTNQGYPLLDQPGRGYFASANAGNWPSSASYTDANYEALMPIYMILNVWNGGAPPASSANFSSTSAYLKANRDFYDPDTTNCAAGAGACSAGVGTGTLALRPANCTTGVAYWATDQGGDWDTTNATSNDGALYRCTAPNTWALYYTPYNHPHPLIAAHP